MHHGRNCTGAVVVFSPDHVEPQLNPAHPPRPTTATTPAYPRGWQDAAQEAAELGIKGFAKLLGPGDEKPLAHCLRFVLDDVAVVLWLRLYAAIRAGVRSAPVDAPDFYDRLMLAIHNAVSTAREVTANG
jgi:hypothetical protein